MTRTRRVLLAVGIAIGALLPSTPLAAQSGYGPGKRVLLDAHNCYPEAGRFRDRIDRALSAGVPLAIEQDLFLRHDPASGRDEIVVAHDSGALVGAPTLESYFFDKIRPIMERALVENKRKTWPLITLNLDFKTNQPALLDAVFVLLGKYEPWLTTAPRTATPAKAAKLTVGPLLVLSGSNPAQLVRFHDAVPVGDKLRVFGAVPVSEGRGATESARNADVFRMTADQIITPRVSNYGRWVNFPWLVVEEGGQARSGEWTRTDAARLKSLVKRAHSQGLWIRFYTLDGWGPGGGDGMFKLYNFGSEAAAQLRWKAAKQLGVDFVATDHYEAFHPAVDRK